MKKNTKITFSKSFSILAAAALSMTLISGQALTTYAGSSSGIESGAVIPDNITIDSPTALSNVALPSNSYGTLSWVDGSYVPEKRVQSCAVVFKPSTGADLSGLPGWDSSSGTLTGYVTVVISSLDSSSDEDESADGSSDKSYDEYYSYKDENNSENNEDTSESSTETSDENSEDGSNEETAEDGNVSEGDSSENSSETENGEDDNKDSAEVTETPDAQDPSTDKTNTDKKEETADNDNADEKKDNTEDNTADDSTDKDSTDKDSTDKDTADSADPDVTETPEATVTPSENENKTDQDKDSDAIQTPEATVTPAEDDSKTDSSSDTDKEDDKKDSKDETPDVTEIPEEDKDNIFDRKDEEEDKRPQNAGTDLTETEKEQTAARNHTCDGITVSGIDLPWYVQFRVSGGEDYEFTNEEDATIFKSYEFELWDTQKNTEYKIPDGEYISVTVPVKAGYTYSIEHLLDNGAMETIIPSVDGGTMTFSTHSFSPFGIAGSKPLVGPDAGTDSSDITKTTPAAASSTDTASSSDTSDITGSDGAENTDSAADLDTSADLSSGTADLEETSSQNSTSGDESEDEDSQTTSKKQVNTGDNTQILPFVILFVAAAVVAGVAVFFKKRKK